MPRKSPSLAPSAAAQSGSETRINTGRSHDASAISSLHDTITLFRSLKSRTSAWIRQRRIPFEDVSLRACVPSQVATRATARARPRGGSTQRRARVAQTDRWGCVLTEPRQRPYQSTLPPIRNTRGGTIARGRRNELPELQLVF